MKNILKTYGSVIFFYIVIIGGFFLLINKNATYNDNLDNIREEIAYNNQ